MTRRKRQKRKLYLGGIVAGLISLIVASVVLIVVILIFITADKGLGKALRPTEYDTYVQKYSQEYNLDENLVYAVIKTESNFNPKANSRVGAMGLMQIMPETFEWLQNYSDGYVQYGTEYLYEPEINIKYGCIFLRFLLDRYDVESSAVAAYNAGFGAVDNWLADSQYSEDGETLYYIPYPETSAYVEKVENAKYYYEINADNE